MRRALALLLVVLVLVGVAAWWLGNGAKFGKTRSQTVRVRGGGYGSKPPVLDIGGVHLASLHSDVPFDLSGYVPANDSVARWWDSLPAVPASQLQDYINSLWRVVDGKGNYTRVFNSQYWQAPPKPLMNETVKVASWRLWCGARLDMIAYLDPKTGYTDVIIYGTIDNMTEYRYCMGLALATELGFDPGTAWGLEHGYTTHFDYYEPVDPTNISMATYLWRIGLPNTGIAVYDWEKMAYHLNFTVKNNGQVWVEVYRNGKTVEEIEYPNTTYFKRDTGLDHVPNTMTITAYNRTHGIRVYMLLEEPVIGISDEMKGVNFTEAFHSVETLFWNTIGYPAFSLAANLRWHGTNITREYTRIAEWAAETARQVVLHRVDHPGNNGPFHLVSASPSSLRASTWGVCRDQSTATAIFVANALGLPSVYYVMHYECPDCWSQAHAISYVLIPTKAYGYNSYWERLKTDYDGDGLPDHLTLIVDTANAGPKARMSEMYYYIILPFGYSVIDAESAMRPVIYYNPIAYTYIRSLPEPLRAPWQNYTFNVINATRLYYWGYEDNPSGAEMTGIDYLLNRTNPYLWTADSWYDMSTDNWWSIGIYNNTPEEILENIDRAATKGAQAMAEALKQPYNKTLIMYVDGINFGNPLHEQDHGSIHVPLTVAGQVYALALQHYHWTINPPQPPTHPQPTPGNIQQAVNHLPKQLNQWNK